MSRTKFTPMVLRWTAALAAALSLSACAPLILGTAVGSAFVATDRRTSGMQLEDQGIKLKARNRIQDAIKDRGHVSVNAYNRMVLLTGEVPTDADRAAAAEAAGQTENVSGVVNELIVEGRAQVKVLRTDEKWFGVTYPQDRPVVQDAIRERIRRGIYPEKLWG